LNGLSTHGHTDPVSPRVEPHNALTGGAGLNFDVDQHGAVQGRTNAPPEVHVEAA